MLKNITFNVDVGEWIAIVGANGSGKSTLAKVLAGLVGVSRGSITSDLPAAVLPSHAAGVDKDAAPNPANFTPLVFQNPEAQILGDRVEEDVLFGLDCLGIPRQDASNRDRVQSVLAQVGLADHRQDLVMHLSGGQKQRLCIADALALDQAGIIFDEATAMLDLASREEILRVVQQLHHAGRTIVWLTQSLEELAYASRVIAITDGAVSYDGNVTDFLYGSPADMASGSACQESPATPETVSSPVSLAPCERLGFAPPYIVSVVRELRKQGISLSSLPLSASELVEVLSS